MPILAAILAFANLLGILVPAILFVLIFVHTTPPLVAYTTHIGEMLLFFLQRTSIRHGLETYFSTRPVYNQAHQPTVKAGSQRRLGAGFTPGTGPASPAFTPVDDWPGWLDSAWLKLFLLIANLAVAAVLFSIVWGVVVFFKDLSITPTQPPIFYFHYGFYLFILILASANVCFNALTLIGPYWRPAYTWAAAVAAVRTVTAVLLFQTEDSLETTRNLVAWPEYQETRLLDGTPIRITSPPGYVLTRQFDLTNKSARPKERAGEVPLAEYAVSRKRYEEIQKRIADGRLCDYGCDAGMAWIGQFKNKPYPGKPDTTLAERMHPRAYTQDYYIIDTPGHMVNDDGQVVATEYQIFGYLVVENELLTTFSVHSSKGVMDEDSRRKHLANHKKWLEALVKANSSRSDYSSE